MKVESDAENPGEKQIDDPLVVHERHREPERRAGQRLPLQRPFEERERGDIPGTKPGPHAHGEQDITSANATCPTMLSRFQNGPCGILWRCSSPSVSASAPHEQIQPQYTPFPQRRIASGISTNVCTNADREPQRHRAFGEHVPEEERPRQHESERAPVLAPLRIPLGDRKERIADRFAEPESNAPLCPAHGSTRYGSRNKGTTWIAIKVQVCRRM